MNRFSQTLMKRQYTVYLPPVIFCFAILAFTIIVQALSTFTAGPAISITSCNNTQVSMAVNHTVNLDPGDQLTFTEFVNGSQVRLWIEATGPYTNSWVSTYFGGTYNITPPYSFTSYWDVVSNGSVIIRYLIQGQCTAVNTGTVSITQVNVLAPVVEVVADDSPQRVFYDNRINDFDTGNSVVLYGKPDADDNWRLEVYNADETGLLLVAYPETIAAVPECPDSNTLIINDEATGISLWRLPQRTVTVEGVRICPFQLNAPSTEAGKTYVIIFDTLYPNTYYVSEDEWIGGR